jgi:hypothetical protein
MSRTQSAACPQVVLDWIAWYPDGELPASVRGAIEVHAAECSACRQEIADLSAEGDAQPGEEAPGADRVFARALQKIQARPQRTLPLPRRRLWLVRPRIAVAAGLAVAVVSGTVGIVATQQLGSLTYETATAATGEAHPAVGPHLDVVFRADASFAEISSAIHALGANVESGPSPSGVVHLHLAAGADPTAAAQRLESGDLAVADFAQPAP